MRQGPIIAFEFVEFIPEILAEGTLYVSMKFATVTHKCCCGCGEEVITPLSPTDWKLIFDGKTITLDPSVGNWGFKCQSHYWIVHSRVTWAAQWSQRQISAGRFQNLVAKGEYFGRDSMAAEDRETDDSCLAAGSEVGSSLWRTLKKWLYR